MAAIDVLSARDWVEVLISGVSILGGFMAYSSGWEASQAETAGTDAVEVGARVNQGLARGFRIGLRTAIVVGAILALE